MKTDRITCQTKREFIVISFTVATLVNSWGQVVKRYGCSYVYEGVCVCVCIQDDFPNANCHARTIPRYVNISISETVQ